MDYIPDSIPTSVAIAVVRTSAEYLRGEHRGYLNASYTAAVREMEIMITAGLLHGNSPAHVMSRVEPENHDDFSCEDWSDLLESV